MSVGDPQLDSSVLEAPRDEEVACDSSSVEVKGGRMRRTELVGTELDESASDGFEDGNSTFLGRRDFESLLEVQRALLVTLGEYPADEDLEILSSARGREMTLGAHLGVHVGILLEESSIVERLGQRRRSHDARHDWRGLLPSSTCERIVSTPRCRRERTGRTCCCCCCCCCTIQFA